MADIRIKDLATTATTTASDDFMAVDGSTNGTRKMNAAAPAFLTSVTTPSLTSPAATNLTLGLGTGGTALTLTSSTLAATFAGAVTVSLTNPEVAIRSASDAAAQRQYLTFGSPNYNRAQFQSVSAGTNDGSLELRTFNAGAQTLTQTWNKDGSSTFAGAVTVSSSAAGSAGAGALVVTGGLATGAASYIGGGLTVNGTITSTAGNNAALFLSTTATTGYQFYAVNSTGAALRIGIEDSAGGALVSGSSPYDTFIGTANATGLTLSTNGTKRLRIDSAGAATFAGAVAIGNTVNTVSPTSPNRTITMVVGGVTLYIAAKTTND